MTLMRLNPATTSATISPSIKAKPEKLKFLVDRTWPLPQILFPNRVTACRTEKTGVESRKWDFPIYPAYFRGLSPFKPRLGTAFAARDSLPAPDC
ncbi:MAG TPA: hypothetical protein PLQ95_02265 [Thiobacillus sp.]|nr:hypothetical protein [Thiobacillus sp.]